MLTNKTKVILLNRGGRIWVTELEATAVAEAMLAKDEVVDIEGQIIRVGEIRGIVNGETYQFTPEKKQEKTNEQYGAPVEKTACRFCDGSGFVIDRNPRIEKGIEYGPAAVPCHSCNADPPRLSW